jgi:hypothetical protein
MPQGRSVARPFGRGDRHNHGYRAHRRLSRPKSSARIGPVARFASAESLIAYSGLAPGVRQSDSMRHDGRIGGGGTDVRLRHYLIEATIWAREIPRWKPTYERIMKRRGAKIGRLAVAQMMLRSIFKVLRTMLSSSPNRRRRWRPASDAGVLATGTPRSGGIHARSAMRFALARVVGRLRLAGRPASARLRKCTLE